MTKLTDLPDEILVEIMLHLNDVPDYLAMLCICWRLYKLKETLKNIQVNNNVILKRQILYEGKFARSLLLYNGNNIASSYFGVITNPKRNLDLKFMVNSTNMHNVKQMCTNAGNIVVFRKKTIDKNEQALPCDSIYIKIKYSWINNDIAEITVYDGIYMFRYSYDKLWPVTKPNLTHFYSLYDEFYKGTKFEDFPGNLLLKALNLIDEILRN